MNSIWKILTYVRPSVSWAMHAVLHSEKALTMTRSSGSYFGAWNQAQVWERAQDGQLIDLTVHLIVSGKLLSALLTGLNDKSLAVRKTNAAAIGHLIKVRIWTTMIRATCTLTFYGTLCYMSKEWLSKDRPFRIGNVITFRTNNFWDYFDPPIHPKFSLLILRTTLHLLFNLVSCLFQDYSLSLALKILSFFSPPPPQVAKDSSVEKLITKLKNWYTEKDGKSTW